MLTNINKALLGAAAIGLAIISFVYNDFAPLWHAIPASIFAREFWVDACACILVAAGVGLCFVRTAPLGVATIGAYYVFWAVGSGPPIFSEFLSFGSWYGVMLASSAIAGAWILYVELRPRDARGVRVAQIVFGLACIFYGCSHFAYADYTASFLPAWLPGRLGFAYFTGACHIAGGLGIALGVLPRLAANLEAIMVSLFGVLIWVPSFFLHPRPAWAGTTQNACSELVVTLVLVAAAWSIAGSLRTARWGFSTSHSLPGSQAGR
jgi:uncharacterized membrane protein YphA (DoxX/SURF4 family)